jgi:hypothetical protein
LIRHSTATFVKGAESLQVYMQANGIDGQGRQKGPADGSKPTGVSPLTSADIQDTLRILEKQFPGMMAAMGGEDCTCPHRDNAELAGTDYVWVSGDCPLHGPAYQARRKEAHPRAVSKPIRKE